jgi:hypothetical protein
MAIYVTGDTHGSQPSGFLSVDGFMRRLSKNSFPEQQSLGKDDYVVICGDFGGVWAANRYACAEPPEEKNALDWLEEKPFTTLFVPGNHENYDRLTGCRNEALLNSWFYERMPDSEKKKLRKGYPQKKWNGGLVREIRPSVLMLERGEIFCLNGQYCLAFGGAHSHDIRDGVLDPAAYANEADFIMDYRKRKGSLIRIKGVSWWEEEMPSQKEMEQGKSRALALMEQHGRVDFVFTHAAPLSDLLFFGYDGQDECSRFLESLLHEISFGCWFYGHLHDNRMLSDNRILLYEQIVKAYGK